MSRSTRRRRRLRRRRLSRYALRLTSFGRHYPPTIACRVSSGRLTALASSLPVRTAGVHRFSYSPAAARRAEARTGQRRRGASSARNTTQFEHIATTSRAHRHLSTSTAAIVPAPACHSPRTCLHALDSDTWVLAGFGSSTCPMKRTNRVHRHRLRRPLLPHPRAPPRRSSRAHSLFGKASVSTIIVGTH